MAEMTIRLRCDPATGKKDIIVSLRADEDALPMEHEQRHRALVEKLHEGGLLSASELGRVIVEREGSEKVSNPPVNAEVEDRRESAAQGERPA
jgi:hypothetical protein